MKIVKTKSKYIIFILGIFLTCINCHKKECLKLKKTEKIIDLNKGFFIEYPYEELQDILKTKNNGKTTYIYLKKKYTKNKLIYNLEIKSNKISNKYEISLEFDGIQIDGVSLLDELDFKIQKKFDKIIKNSFVVQVLYKSIIYNYVYVFNNKSEKLVLKEIYYYENTDRGIKTDGFNDTIGYFVKFPINEFVGMINKEKINNINHLHNWDRISNKEVKWEIE